MGRSGAKVVFLFVVLILLGWFCWASEGRSIKSPNVAGTFYPQDPQNLRDVIIEFLEQARLPEGIEAQKVVVLFSPHAGYVFSGPVAGYSYALLRKIEVDEVIVLAPSHFYPFYGIRAMDYEGYRTPLGIVSLDTKAAEELVDSLSWCSFDNRVFEREHSIEVQLPFLQVTKRDVKVVPLLFGDLSWTDLNQESIRFCEWIRKKSANSRVLVLVSTDMSHYYPYQKCVKKDWATIDVLRKFHLREFFFGARSRKYEMCGWIPTSFALAVAKQLGKVEFRLLKYANSGDTYGDKSRVVGYMSAVIIEKENKEVSMFTKEQKAKLLRLARRSIEHYLKTGRRLEDLEIDDPALYKEKGAFVTLKKNGMLRGCIGHIIADMPLCEVVAEMAIQAAVGDPRFPPLTLEELPEVEIEISVLSPLKKVEDINEIKVGKHGLLLRKGFYSGLLLPQVPVEYGWDKLTFLRHLAMKAGLPPDEWKDAEIYSFTAEVFSESEVFGGDGTVH